MKQQDRLLLLRRKMTMTDQENILNFNFPAKSLAELWCKESYVPPEFRLFELTHYRTSVNGEIKYISYLADEIPDEFSQELDSLSLFDPQETNKYFTNRRIAQLKSEDKIHTELTNEIVQNKKGLGEYMALIHAAINLILEDSNNDKKWLEDVQFLFDNLKYMHQNSDKSPEIVIQSMCYAADMLIFSWIEKLLRIACLDKRKSLPEKEREEQEVKQKENILTLGNWLNENNKVSVELLGEAHIKNLKKFLSKYGGVGFNYRNSLTHWDNINKEMLKPIFVSKMLWLFTDVLNTVLSYFLDKREKLKLQNND